MHKIKTIEVGTAVMVRILEDKIPKFELKELSGTLQNGDKIVLQMLFTDPLGWRIVPDETVQPELTPSEEK